MPFVDDDLYDRGSELLTHTRQIFIGRTIEVDFFVHSILKPEIPAYNIISISGRSGIGKSTLIKQFMEIFRTSDFKNQCLITMVNKRQTIPSDLMEIFSNQLRELGYPLTKFESEINHYKENLHKIQFARDESMNALGQKLITDLAGATLKEVPLLGELLEKEVGSIIEASAQEFHYHQGLKEAKRQEDPLGVLSRAFVDDLNYLASLPVPINPKKARRWGRITRLFNTLTQHSHRLNRKHERRMRILLFFDAFDRLAPETVPWLLDSFLESNISKNIVLVCGAKWTETAWEGCL